MTGISNNIELIKDFIDREILTPNLELNSCSQDGNHTGFIVSSAKRLGLESKKIGHGYYFYDENRCIGGVREMKTSLVSSLAVSISARKHITKQLLATSGISTPKGESFSLGNFDEANTAFRNNKGPMVVKPSSAAAGEGVKVGVSNEIEFAEAWQYAKKASSGGGAILIEEIVTGIDVRVYVVDGKVAAAATRIPPFVIGDGISSVSELIKSSNQQRKKHKYLGRMPIVSSDSALAAQDLTLTSIPDAGKTVVVNMTVNLHQGGTSMDVTKRLCDDLKDLAVRAAAAIPGFSVGGVDLMISDLDSSKNAVVLETNTSANISVHHLPGFGEQVKVSDAIVHAMKKSAINN
ncbi:ATP-binding protein [Corynebacterium casei]|uniref:ATP-binding protein n=1 Tax=Corynebacterium casei TaxID=160386 RepID=UPI003FD1A302